MNLFTARAAALWTGARKIHIIQLYEDQAALILPIRA
jgi:hypothetical protein